MAKIHLCYCGAFQNIIGYAMPVHPKMALEVKQPNGLTHLITIQDIDVYLAASCAERNSAVRELLTLNRVKDIPNEPLVKWGYLTKGHF